MYSDIIYWSVYMIFVVVRIFLNAHVDASLSNQPVIDDLSNELNRA
jgi:hypothetical protein